MNTRKVTVVGLGMLGTQIAIQAAAYGHRVCGFDPDRTAFERMQGKVLDARRMVRKGPTFAVEQWEQHAAKVKVHLDLAAAVRHADLVIEAAPENLAVQRAVYAEFDRLAPGHAILATNSSTMPVSLIETATGRPGCWLYINLYQPAIGMYMADVMGGTSTTPETLAAARDFVRSAQCVPLRVQREILGYCFNSVWRSVTRQTLYMWANGFVDFRDLDRTWMVFTGMTYGPFFLMDLVGLGVSLAVERIYWKDSGDTRDEPPGRAGYQGRTRRAERQVRPGFLNLPGPRTRARELPAERLTLLSGKFQGNQEAQRERPRIPGHVMKAQNDIRNAFGRMAHTYTKRPEAARARNAVRARRVDGLRCEAQEDRVAQATSNEYLECTCRAQDR